MTARRHRGRGAGSIYKDGNGKWWASVSLPVDPDTCKSPRRKMSAPDQETGRQKLKELLAELETTGTVARKDTTVADAIAGQMSHPPASWKTPSTLSVNALHARHLTGGLGQYLLSRLSVQAVEDYLASEGRRGMSRSAVAGQLRLLRRVIRRPRSMA